MLKTILILITTLVVLPFVAFKFDQPLTGEQWHIMRTAIYIMLGFATYCFLAGELTGNVSQVDKLWSITPVVYAWFFAAAGDWSPRLVLMAVMVTVWGVRLTYNFSRRGAYRWKFWSGEEDYRWEVVRETPLLKGRVRWALFNLFFISLYQNTLLLLIVLPMVVAWRGRELSLGVADILAAAFYIGFVVIETIADQQQWNFQQEKHRRINAGEKPNEEQSMGFISSGLFAKVRHPNYAAEQAIWVTFYMFSVAATGRWVNWSLAGSLLLILLFQSSSDFSEGISSKKYPAYAEYKRRVGRFLPGFW